MASYIWISYSIPASFRVGPAITLSPSGKHFHAGGKVGRIIDLVPDFYNKQTWLMMLFPFFDNRFFGLFWRQSFG